MKLLSIVIPAYNAQKYLAKAIESTININNQLIEVIVVNDGSVDQTMEVAQSYQQTYPQTVVLVNQENKGHGGAVNTGMAKATGKYLKILDADDWFDRQALEKVMTFLANLEEKDQAVEVLFTNYVYEHEGIGPQKIVSYEHVLPINQSFTWEQTKGMPFGKFFMMHSMIYHREFLQKTGLQLPEHTFYVDNLFVYEPMKQVKTMYYLPVDFYRYYIGRDDQSINEQVMMKRIDQQLKVNYLMIDASVDIKDVHANQQRYLFNHLEIVTNISLALLNRINNEDALAKKEKLWQYLAQTNPALYRKMRWALLGLITKPNNQVNIWLANQIYFIMRKLAGYAKD